MRLPEFPVVNVINAFPDFRLAAAQMPSRAKMTIVEAKHLRSQPGRNMDAVGNVSDGNRVLQLARKESSPHGAGDFTVQRGYRIGAARELQTEHGHAETFVTVGILASQRHEIFLGKPEGLAQRSEVLFDQIGIEAIMAGGHRSVGREDHFTGNSRHRHVETDALLFHALANRFEDCKSAVSFVQVKNSGSDAERFQSAQAANAEKQFLMHADAAVASVQTRGHLAVLGSIAFHVGVEEKQITATHFHAPYFCVNGAMAGIDLHHNRPAICPDGSFHSKLADIGLEILFVLPAIAIEALAEISLTIKQAHANQRDPEIGGALDVIAGQNSKSPGIHRKRFVHAKFGGEISHGTGSQHTRVARTPGSLRFFVLTQAAIGVVDPAVQDKFRSARFEFGERILVQQRDRTVIELTPTQRIEIAEQAGGIVIPAPPQVASQRPEPLLGGRDETVEHAGFAHYRRNPGRGLREQANLFLREDTRLQSLNHQNALQHTAINERNSQERLIIIFAGFTEILKPRMIPDVFNGHRADLFRDQAGQSFIDRHAKLADAIMAKPERRCQNEISAVWLQQVR